MTFREAFITSLRAVGVPDGLVLDALLAAEAAERARRAAARAARLGAATKPDSAPAGESGLPASPVLPSSAGGPAKDRARRGLLLGTGLKPAAEAVAAVLIERFNLGTGQCNPGIPDIAGRTALSERSVRRALAQLDAAGLIARVVHGSGRTNAYRPNWDALAALARWPVGKPDSHANRTPVATKPDSGVRQNNQGNIQPPDGEARSKRRREPDRRQGSLLLPITTGRAAVAENAAQSRLWADLHRHFQPHGPRALEAATLRLMDGGLAEKATAAEQSRRGEGLRVILQVLREAG